MRRTAYAQGRIARAAAVCAMAFASCVPFEEGARRQIQAPQAASAPARTAEPVVVPPRPEAPAPAQGTLSATPAGPMDLDARMIEVAADIETIESSRQKAERLFNELRSGARKGVRVMDMGGRAPRTASEAMAQGGDCTELALIVASVMDVAGMEGGVQLVRFKDSPPDKFHLIAYALIDKRKVVIDLQTDRLGKTKDGRYDVVMDLPLAKAEWMYYRELGDYGMDKEDCRGAAIAYEKAARINPADAYVQHNMAVAYERSGQFEKALSAIDAAVALDTKYEGARSRIRFNAGVHLGIEAAKEKRWSDCADAFQQALDSGEKMSGEERGGLQSNRDMCRKKAGN